MRHSAFSLTFQSICLADALSYLFRAFSSSSLNFNSFSHVSQSRRIIISADSIWNNRGHSMLRNKNTFHKTWSKNIKDSPIIHKSPIDMRAKWCKVLLIATFLWMLQNLALLRLSFEVRIAQTLELAEKFVWLNLYHNLASFSETKLLKGFKSLLYNLHELLKFFGQSRNNNTVWQVNPLCKHYENIFGNVGQSCLRWKLKIPLVQ